ncbi:MAG: hypothetical protein LC127_15775, partial [Chitinophagales bacterium]|nr:hypothetical protein [Chitinophagales bacterium]
AYYGAQIEYDNTTNSIYYLPGWDKSFFYKYDISNQTWSRLSDAPGNIGYGGSMRNVNGELYILRGANTTVFYKYDIAKDSWLVPTVGLFGGAFRGTDYRTYGYGAEIVKGDGDNYYLVRGNYDNIFIRYNAVTGESTQMADAPAGFYLGGSMTYDSTNNKIYAICNSYYRKLFVYDIATDVWTEETADPPPVDASYGSDLEYDNSRYIYWIPGGGTQTFYRFDTQGTTGNKWGTALANTPSTMSYGADLVVKDDYLYATRGNNQLGFYRYGPLSGTATWNDSAVADLPTGGNIYYDGFLVDGGGDYLYACRGANTRGCYRYSISGNSWAAISDAPDLIYTGGAAASNRSDRILVIAGAGSNTFSNGLYTYIMQTNNSAFEESGTFTSTVHDLTSVYRYANLSVIYTDATNSALTISTRTSADNVEWNNWTDVSEEKHIGTTYLYKIGSPTNRYLQVKFTFTSSDGVYSGAVSDYTVNYYVDNTAPENPADDGFSAYTTATASANLTTNTWANYSNPYFTWAAAEAAYGASDGTGGSGIAGYYVYFGTDSQANASESGTLVTDSEYTASNLTSGETYYLRIQAVDEAGNFSDTNWQPFIYKFDNTPPENPSTVVVNPSGYTNVNDYTFTWSGATDSASLIKQYWYKAGPTGTESATLEATASGVTKYTTGANTFYLQAQDHAGNRAASWVTASYYYSGTAAGAPQNLRITHPSGSDSNTVNEFAFAWDPPSFYFGQQASLRYHYWINRLPSAGTAENATGLAVAYLSKGAYAQDPGENTLYVVAEDEAGNIDYNNYASITFTSSTSAPGAPRNLDISDVSIKETEAWRLALSWDQPSSSGSGIAEYRIYRSEVEDAECDSEVASDSDFSYIASTTQT